jgi:two-component system NtrC family sensor kinase
MKISSKLILAVGLVSLAIIGVLSILIIGAQGRNQIQQEAEYARSLAETIRSSARYAMLHNRREDVEQIIRTVGEQEEISEVRIFNKEGRIVYAGDSDTLGTVVAKDTEACVECHRGNSPAERLSQEGGLRFYHNALGQSVLGVIRPIYNEPSCFEADCHAHPADQTVLGVLDVSMPLESVERQLATSRRNALVLAAIAILATSLTIWLFLRFLVAKPVRQLLEATKTVATGDLDYRLEVKRNDELGQLGGSFNEMTSKLAETQSQLYQSNRLASVGRLAAGIAHEINNPLTGVLTYSSLLLRSAPEGSELRNDLETVVRETKRCRDIVKGLLDFSRQVPPHKTNVDMSSVVERALEIVDHQLTVSDIQVTKSCAENLPTIRADANQMVQVLINLLVNAADAIGSEGGEIFISTDSEEVEGKQWVLVKVADTGCGIRQEDRDKIFEPFFTTKDTKGTGLGLAVLWGILEEHGATVSVHSRPQRGTTFTIRLPVEGEAVSR